MKKLLALLALVIAIPASAGPVENMAAQCNWVMDLGECRVALDPKDYPNATIPIMLGNGQIRRIPRDIYLAIAAMRFQKDEQGRWLMCAQILAACGEWDSPECLTYRSLFRQTAP